jgi:RNA polymerase sigma-70 factor, ECF subfamily
MTANCMTLGTAAPSTGLIFRRPAAPAETATLPADHRDAAVVAALLAGDEPAFESLVNRYHGAMVRVAMAYVGRREVAEEVAQETWMAVLQGLSRFQGRSSLKNWLFRILTNRAKTRGAREGRTIPMSALHGDDDEGAFGSGAESFDPSGRWLSDKAEGSARTPERRLLDAETQEAILSAIASLPPKQRIVITMRDVEGFSSQEVRALLELSETYQRVLLHRARLRVREKLLET